MSTITGLSRSANIKWLITVVLTVICLVIPEQGIYTHEVKLFLAVTVFSLALMAFEIVPALFIAFVMPVSWMFLNLAPASVVMSNYASTTIVMIAGSMFLGATLEDCGLLKRIAFALMCLSKGSYFALLIAIMITGMILNILAAGMGYLVIAALAAGLCVSLDGMHKRIGVGIATAAMLGGCTSHSFTYQAGMWSLIMNMGSDYLAPTVITPLSLMMHCWPMFFICLLILFIVAKWYKPEAPLGEVTYFKETLNAMGPLTRREKANLLMMSILLIYTFTVDFHKLDLNLGFGLIPWMVYLPFINGADEETVKKFNVPMVFFMGSCMGIGSVATHLGLGDAIANACIEMLAGNTSPAVIMALVFVVVFILNFLMTPMAIFALITVPMCILATNAGFSPIPFMYAINACSEAILLPYEYVPYLIIYSYGMMSMIDFIKVNILRSVVFFAGFLILLIPYWTLIGLF